MPVTWKAAKEELAKYAETGGLCADNPKVDLFTRKVLDYLLINASFGNVRKFCFCAIKGCFTLPYELEVPQKIKIDGVIGSVWNRWFEYHQTNTLDGCLPIEAAAIEDPNNYPTVYPVPDAGARVGVLGTCDESPDAHVIIKGKDTTGREIITSHKGEQIVGEYLQIKKGCLLYTNAPFGEVTEVYKTPTVGYATLFWLNLDVGLKGFLADYSPLETLPQYRRYRLTVPCNAGPTKVSVLGKIRLKAHYTDTDLIPFDNLYALSLAGQAVNFNANRNVEGAMAADKQLTEIVQRDNAHHSPANGQPLEFFGPLSPGSIGNIVGSNILRGRWG